MIFILINSSFFPSVCFLSIYFFLFKWTSQIARQSQILCLHHHSADYINFSVLFGITEFNFSRLRIEFHLRRCLGAWPVLHISLLVMNRLNKPSLLFSFFFFDVVLAFKGSNSSEPIDIFSYIEKTF